MSDLIPDEEREAIEEVVGFLASYGEYVEAEVAIEHVRSLSRFVLPEPAEVQHLWDPEGNSMCGGGGTFDEAPDLGDRLIDIPVCAKCFIEIRREQRDSRWGSEPAEVEWEYGRRNRMTGGPLNNEEDGYDSPFPRVVVAAPSDTDRDFKRIPAETRAELIHMAEGRIKDVWADSPEGVDAATLASNVVAAQEFVWMQLAAGVDLRASQPVQVEVTTGEVEHAAVPGGESNDA